METFTIGDLVVMSDQYYPNFGYFYILNSNGESRYYNIDWQDTGWYSINDKLTHPRFNEIYSDIFRELKGNYEKK